MKLNVKPLSLLFNVGSIAFKPIKREFTPIKRLYYLATLMNR